MNDRSPCLECSRKGEDKNDCAPICKKLEAWNRGDRYDNLSVPEVVPKTDTEETETKTITVKCSRCGKREPKRGFDKCGICLGVLMRKEKEARRDEQIMKWKDMNRLVTRIDKQFDEFTKQIKTLYGRIEDLEKELKALNSEKATIIGRLDGVSSNVKDVRTKTEEPKHVELRGSSFVILQLGKDG